jgi:hypothetical protein
LAKGLWSFTDTEEALKGREKKRWSGLPEGLRDLISSCLRVTPGERPSARTLQVHPHFATIAALKASKELEARLSEAESRARKAEARAAAAEKKVAALEEEIRVVSPGGRSTGSGGGGGGSRASPSSPSTPNFASGVKKVLATVHDEDDDDDDEDDE